MRILLAIDGSEPAARALELVDHVKWPAGSVIRVVSALQHGADLVPNPHVPSVRSGTGIAAPSELETPAGPDPRDIESSLVRRLDDALDAAVLELDRPDRTVERMLLRGRAATAIVEEAVTFAADLIVVGHRGHGRLPSLLLGSVSAEVVDRAPCPVLVARGTAVGSLLLAADGSLGAASAERFLLDHPVFAGLPIRVVSVAEVGMPWSTGMSPGIYDQVIESYSEAVDEARREGGAIAAVVASHLSKAGYEAVAETREGDPAGEIIGAAEAHGTDLIVTGTRGHRGLTRLILGSTARKLLSNAPCSVLVVRESPAAAKQKPAGARTAST